jgi:hypothetical protein
MLSLPMDVDQDENILFLSEEEKEKKVEKEKKPVEKFHKIEKNKIFFLVDYKFVKKDSDSEHSTLRLETENFITYVPSSVHRNPLPSLTLKWKVDRWIYFEIREHNQCVTLRYYFHSRPKQN